MKAKLRREIGQLLKKYKLPSKLYRGHKFLAYRQFTGQYLKALKQGIPLCAPGSVVNNCDGLNHVVEGIDPGGFNGDPSKLVRRYRTKGYDFQFPSLLLKDGNCLCDDGWGIPTPGIPRDYIEEFLLRYYNMLSNKEGWPLTEEEIKRRDTLRSGGHITDERGILLDEFKTV